MGMETLAVSVRDGNLSDPRREKLKLLLKEKGLLWGIAAMVDGSLGYHSPKSAEIRLNALLEDRFVRGCERSSACFEGDPISEIEHDFQFFQHVEESDPERVERIIAFVEQVEKLDTMTQEGIGLMYPTMGV